ncbi:MAG: hypothetical protein M3512_14505 [Bacteroidota bacterium]|nr:hypothetical protein [Bacteroidota bacterium]
METLGHQTLEDRDNADYIENNGPFKCTMKEAFLGEGYYFWENNIDLAHIWGRVRYNGNYVICDAKLNVDELIFLDLLGNRNHQIYFQTIIQKLGLKGRPIGKIIEFLKELEKRPDKKGIFPFKIIRAVDSSKNVKDRLKFSDKRESYLNINPVIIICLVEKNNLVLQAFKIIYPEAYFI